MFIFSSCPHALIVGGKMLLCRLGIMFRQSTEYDESYMRAFNFSGFVFWWWQGFLGGFWYFAYSYYNRDRGQGCLYDRANLTFSP